MANWYTAHNEDGDIVATYMSDADHADANAPIGSTVIEGEHYYENGYISGGAYVEYTAEQAALKKARPGFGFTWSNASMAWVDGRSLIKAKLDQWEKIKAARTAAIDSNMTTPYGIVQCDAVSRQNITDGIKLAEQLTAMSLPVEITWTMADNTDVVLNLASITNIGLLLGQKIQAAYANGRVKRTALEAATTNAEVEAITW